MSECYLIYDSMQKPCGKPVLIEFPVSQLYIHIIECYGTPASICNN